MKTNAIKLTGKIISLGDVRYFEGKNGKVASIYGRIAIPQPIRVEVEGKPVYKDTVMDFQCVGTQAEFIDKYIRAYHKSEDGKKGGFIARLVSVSCYLEQYVGKVLNEETMSIELDDFDVAFDKHELEIQATKTRLRILGLDALDYIEKEEDEKPAKGASSSAKGKVTPKSESGKGGGKPTVKGKSGSKTAKKDEYEEVMDDIDDEEQPF